MQASSFAEGYLDRQTFLHYDHKKGRAEPWGRWAEQLEAETWKTESKDLNETWKELGKLLAEILSLQKENEIMGPILGEDSLEEGMSTHFSILAWRIPWTEEPGSLQSTGLHSDTTEAT